MHRHLRLFDMPTYWLTLTCIECECRGDRCPPIQLQVKLGKIEVGRPVTIRCPTRKMLHGKIKLTARDGRLSVWQGQVCLYKGTRVIACREAENQEYRLTVDEGDRQCVLKLFYAVTEAEAKTSMKNSVFLTSPA